MFLGKNKYLRSVNEILEKDLNFIREKIAIAEKNDKSLLVELYKYEREIVELLEVKAKFRNKVNYILFKRFYLKLSKKKRTLGKRIVHRIKKQENGYFQEVLKFLLDEKIKFNLSDVRNPNNDNRSIYIDFKNNLNQRSQIRISDHKNTELTPGVCYYHILYYEGKEFNRDEFVKELEKAITLEYPKK